MADFDTSKLNIDSDELTDWTEQYDEFLSKWTWDGKGGTELGNIAISDQGLVGGKFVTDDPITTYTPPTTGTSEGQLLVIRGCLELYLKTSNSIWLTRARTLTDALLKYFYPQEDIPEAANYAWVPHWLVNVTAPFTSREYFLDGKATFVNGVATVTFDQVFKIFSVRATDATLEYDWAPDSPIKTGQGYEIDSVDVAYGKSSATIYLKDKTFSGNALVAYVSETGPVIEKGEMCEAYPCWRPLDDGEIACAIDSLPWALDVFKLWYQITKADKWHNAIDSTTASIEAAYTVDNVEYYLKPGKPDQAVLSNGVTSYSSRTTKATYTNVLGPMILINFAQSDGEESIGTWVGDHLEFSSKRYIEAKLGTDISQKISLILDEESTYDPKKRWTTSIYTSGKGTTLSNLETFDLTPSDFFKSTGVWWGHGYSSDGDGNASNSGNSSVSATDKIDNINGKKGIFKRIDLTRGDEGGWYGWSQYVIVGSYTALPFDISYRTSSQIDFVINDSKGQKWQYRLPTTNGAMVKRTLTVSNFTNADGAPTSDLSAGKYNNMLVDAVDNSSSIDIEYLGHKVVMSDPAKITNMSISYSQNPALSLAIAYVLPMPKRNPLPYAPYIAPFDMHLVNGNVDDNGHDGSIRHTGGTLSDLRGAPYTGYQAPWIFQESSAFNDDGKIGNKTALSTNLSFLSAAQDYYQKNTGLRGFFAPVYWWDYREDANGHPVNTFDMTGPWGNVWGGFQYRTISDVARVISNDKNNAQAKKIFIDFVTAMNSVWLDSDVINTFPTDFNDKVKPAHSQNDPHMVALFIRALALGYTDTFTTAQTKMIYTLVNRGLTYLSKLHYPISDTPFSMTQVEGTFSPNPYINEWYEYWGGDILSGIAHLLPTAYSATKYEPFYYVYIESNLSSNEKTVALENDSEYYGTQVGSPSVVTITGPCSVNPSWKIIQNGLTFATAKFNVTLANNQSLVVSSYPEDQYARVYNGDGSYADVSQFQDFTKTNYVRVPEGTSTVLAYLDTKTGFDITFREERLLV